MSVVYETPFLFGLNGSRCLCYSDEQRLAVSVPIGWLRELIAAAGEQELSTAHLQPGAPEIGRTAEGAGYVVIDQAKSHGGKP